MALIPYIHNNDWQALNKALRKLAALKLGPDADVTFDSLTLDDLTANRLVSSDSNKKLVSVADLTSWIAGTTNQITITDDSDGTITLATPQDIHTGATPSFVGMSLTQSGANDSILNFATNSVIRYKIGVDHSDATKLMITAGTSFPGTPGIVINTSGQVAFGHTNPGAIVDIQVTGGDAACIVRAAGANDAVFQFGTDGTARWTIGCDDDNAEVFAFTKGTGAIGSDDVFYLRSDPLIDCLVNTAIRDGNELRFFDSGNSNYVGFEAPALTADQIWVLPNADGSANELLKTDGGGNLSWTGSLTLTDITLNNTGLHVLDTNASHDLIIAPGSDLTADRTLTLTTGDSDRTITLSGNPTLNDWFDQTVKAGSDVTFNDITVSTPSNIYALSHDSFADFVGNEHIDHTGVTLTAGTGLTGGGDISANRTFAVDGVLEDLDTLGANAADSEFLVGTAAGALAWETGATVRTSIGLGTTDSPTFTNLTMESAVSNAPVLTIKNTNADSMSAGLSFYHDSATPADNDWLAQINFFGDDSAGANTHYAQIRVDSSDITDGAEAGHIDLRVIKGAAMLSLISIGGEDTAGGDPLEVVINEDSADCDFRVESDTNVNALFVRGSDSQVAIGHASPASKFDVDGIITSTGLTIEEVSADPGEPSEGTVAIWLSDGTGYGDDGDVCIASKAAGATKKAILFDHSAGDAW